MTEPFDSNSKPHAASNPLEGPENLLRAAAYVAQKDINGIRQIAKHLGFSDGVPTEFVQAPTKNSLWSAAGDTLGNVAEFVVLQKTIGTLMPSVKSTFNLLPIITMGLTGGVDAALKPVDADDTDFADQKLRQVKHGIDEFAIMGTTQRFFEAGAIFGRAGRRTLADSIAANALSGAEGGAMAVYLDSADKNHKPVSWSEFGSAAISGAIFGSVFGVADWKFNKVVVSTQHSSEFRSNYPDHNLPSTEKIVGLQQFENIGYLGSPMFDWLAKNDPKLKLSNYKDIMKDAPPGYSLYLRAFPPEKRVDLIKTLRKYADPHLSSDVNIDEFIGAIRARNPQVRNAFVDETTNIIKAEADWHNAYNELTAAVKTHAPAADVKKLVTGEDARAKEPAIADAIKKTLDQERQYLSLPRDHQFTNDTQISIAKFADRLALTQPEYSFNEYLREGAQYDRGNIDIASVGVFKDVTSKDIDIELHEWSHHADGTFDLRGILRRTRGKLYGVNETSNYRTAYDRAEFIDKRVLPKIAKGDGKNVLLKISEPNKMPAAYVFTPKTDARQMARYSDLTKKGRDLPAAPIPESISTMRQDALSSQEPLSETQTQNLKMLLEERVTRLRQESKELYFSEYVGSKHELKAFSTGALAHIRARAWGYPEHNLPVQMPEKIGDQSPQPLLHLMDDVNKTTHSQTS